MQADARLLPVKGGFRYFVTEHPLDQREVVERNHRLVQGVATSVGADVFFVTTAGGGRVVLGTDQGGMDRLVAGLVDAASDQPIQVRARTQRGTTATGTAYQRLRQESGPVAAIEVFVGFHDPVTKQRFEAPFSCLVEVWAGDDRGGLVAPSLNGRAASLPADELSAEEVVVAGERTVTYPALSRPGPLEVGFPVDAVYLWVDGSDERWRARKASRLQGLPQEPRQEATADVRFDQGDELRYSLRSLARYAPWVRRVFVVTDQQRPAWLVEEPGRLDVIDHRDLLDANNLPTFNSHAITGSVHRIEGLAEHFLLMNDDVLFGRPATANDFFFANGSTRFFPSRSALPPGPVRPEDHPLVVARKRSRDLIEELTGTVPTFGFRHTPVPFSRSLLAELAADLPQWQATVASPFRSGDDIVPSWLHHYVGFARGVCYPSSIRYAYFDIGDHLAIQRLRALVAQAQRPTTLCVNDVTETTVAGRHRHVVLNEILSVMFPWPSRFEGDRAG